jgi:5-methylcytosine-specific restriction endonuclease McrA
MKKYIMERDNWICAYCGESASEMDHVVPKHLGGKIFHRIWLQPALGAITSKALVVQIVRFGGNKSNEVQM